MPHSLTTDMLAVTKAQVTMPIIFVEIDCNGGNIYAWNGLGTIDWNSIEWLGAGDFGNISQITETTLLQAAGVSFTLSGVPESFLSAALADLRRYLPAKVWVGAMNESFAIISDPYLLFNGRVDTGMIADGGTTATITVTAESRLITMKNTRQRRYTDQDQRIEHPTDSGFAFVDSLQNASIQWHS